MMYYYKPDKNGLKLKTYEYYICYSLVIQSNIRMLICFILLFLSYFIIDMIILICIGLSLSLTY